MFEIERLPAPDNMGFFFHPDIPGNDESDDVVALCKQIGFQAAFVSMDSDAPDDVIDAYGNGDIAACSAAWTPTKPDGDGWLLVAKYDTEDGLVAMFVRCM
jgi:hypothetical protein